jgi:hypothetical protein
MGITARAMRSGSSIRQVYRLVRFTISAGEFEVRLAKRDLVKVASVRIDREGKSYQIARCWVYVASGSEAVEIWLSPDQDAPQLRIPLSEVTIEWPDLEILV